MRKLVFYIFLLPLIALNYRLRYHRFRQDRWYWADKLALSWGYYYCPRYGVSDYSRIVDGYRSSRDRR